MIYLDNAATSFPKPRGMADLMAEFINHRGGSFGRGGYKTAIKNSEDILSVRMSVVQVLKPASLPIEPKKLITVSARTTLIPARR